MPDAPKCVEDHESDAPARLQQAEDDQRDGGELHGLVKWRDQLLTLFLTT